MPPATIELLTRQHATKHFNCGDADLDRYLKQFALTNTKKGFGKTYVAVEPGQKIVLGYYTISTSSVALSLMPEPAGMPRIVPMIRIGRLAVTQTAQGQRLGSDLLIHALKTALAFSQGIGAYAVEVDALNDHARRFYSKYGFETFLDDELHLFLTMKKIEQLEL